MFGDKVCDWVGGLGQMTLTLIGRMNQFIHHVAWVIDECIGVQNPIDCFWNGMHAVQLCSNCVAAIFAWKCVGNIDAMHNDFHFWHFQQKVAKRHADTVYQIWIDWNLLDHKAAFPLNPHFAPVAALDKARNLVGVDGVLHQMSGDGKLGEWCWWIGGKGCKTNPALILHLQNRCEGKSVFAKSSMIAHKGGQDRTASTLLQWLKRNAPKWRQKLWQSID